MANRRIADKTHTILVTIPLEYKERMEQIVAANTKKYPQFACTVASITRAAIADYLKRAGDKDA